MHSLLKTAGKRIFIIGALFELIDAYQKGQSWGKAFVNTTVALGCFSIGGVPGLIIGIAYFGLDTLGAFDGPDFDKGVFEPTSDPFQPYYSPADNTRVLLPCIPPELIRNADGFNASHIDSTKLQRLLLDE